MPATRRRFLAGSSTAVGLLGGCAGLGGQSGRVEELTIELGNGTDERHAFRFAVETAEGLGEWESHEVPPGTKESVVRDPAAGESPVAVRGTVDGKSARGRLLGVENADRDLCPRLLFEYGRTDEPVFLQYSDAECDES
ncbi:hypothetical protein [Halorussus salinus]|uniref:hypothetical protein n=1 Tax=Halorussus salinus TaxID=1364935 RepID=UPI001091DE8D|nr:hypothetical protein [Halorussus salinus]